ncbi:MAG TPA: hypothetical protein VFR68_14425 [Candidatus Dormibacteraeota bacterium]|nr:hypothetical protein [Candidatus Dormibacteraeota bacterium]
MKRFTLLLLALALSGCGAQGSGSTPPTTVSGTNGPFHAVASPARLSAGGTVNLSLTVSGPIEYEIGCVQTLHIWAEDANAHTVWEEPVPGIQCMAYGSKRLAFGGTATFTAAWPTSGQLAAGSYTIHGLFLTVLPRGAGMRVRENLPPLTIEILR